MRCAMSEFEGKAGKHMLTLSSSQFDPKRALRSIVYGGGLMPATAEQGTRQ
jgi:hypothetical protein